MENIKKEKREMIINIEKPMCGRCYDEVDEIFPPNCDERPELYINFPIGMCHCPDCGAMLVAGCKHPYLCKKCLERKHPAFDKIEKDKNE